MPIAASESCLNNENNGNEYEAFDIDSDESIFMEISSSPSADEDITILD